MESPAETRILGWRPMCQHQDAPASPCTVLDCFAGSGSTLVAAQRLGRRSVGADLSSSYLALAKKRLEGVPLPLGSGPGKPPERLEPTEAENVRLFE